MSNGLIAFVSLIYFWVALLSIRDNNIGMAVVFTAYAVANVGLIIVNKGA